VIYQVPYVTDNGGPATAQPAYLQSVRSSEQLSSGRATSWSIVAENFEKVHAGVAPANNVRLGALANVNVGILGGSNRWFYGYWVVEKTPSDQYCEYLLTDLLGIMDLYQWDSGYLNFKYWNPYWAASFLCDSAGLGADWQDFEYFPNQRLYNDWDYKMGTSGGAMLTDLFYRGQHKAGIWYDPIAGQLKSGCPFCRAKRVDGDGEPNYAAHQSAGWNSPGCLAVDIARAGPTGIDIELSADQDYRMPTGWHFTDRLEARKGTIRAGEYADRITVFGEAFDGTPIGLWWEDDDASGKGTYNVNTYIGHRVNHVENDPGLRTWGDVNLKLQELVEKMGSQHLHLSFISMPLDVDVRPGWVVRVWGGTAMGANGKKFRVIDVSPRPDTGRTVLSAHEMI
ncbi:MAG TPA: hypothetical protein VMW58_00575, partial [Anaerolineae bacterium]|nr:hypothetical protein [Anaerolineae bacterium]